jgi:hypothetical protein
MLVTNQLIERREQRNDMPPFAPINQKIFVGRKNLAVAVQFS